MTHLEAVAWFKDAATRLKVLSGFYRNVDEFKDAISTIKRDALVLVLDEPKGALSGQHNSNVRDGMRIGFFVYGYAENKHYEDEDKVYEKAKSAAFKVLGKAYYERLNQSGLFKWTNIDSVDYQKSGPVFTDWIGCYVYFIASDNANAQLTYNPDDWDPL